jgi:hypothetical protein
MSAHASRYHPIAPLGTAIVVLLWLSVALDATTLLATAFYLAHMNRWIDRVGGGAIPDGTEALVPAEVVQVLAGLFGICVYLGLIVLVCIWLHRAAWNVRHFGATRLEISPGMAVGWYFIPFANLVMPFRAMREIWLASHDPANWRSEEVPLLRTWWGLWLAANIAGNLSTRTYMRAETLEQLRAAEWAGLGASALSLVGAIVFIRVVRYLGAAQALTAAASLPPGPAATADGSGQIVA